MPTIPPQAKRVFNGVIFDVYQWEQELYNGKTATFEMLKRADSVVVLALSGETVYYAWQEQPNKPRFLSLFGGQVDPGESALAAAQRELLEEAGMTSTQWEHWKTVAPASKIDWDVHVYIARDCRAIADQQLDGGEIITIHSMPVREFIPYAIKNELRDREVYDAFVKMELGLENKEAFLQRLLS